MPCNHCFCALEIDIYNFLIGCGSREKMPWCPCLFKIEAYTDLCDCAFDDTKAKFDTCTAVRQIQR